MIGYKKNIRQAESFRGKRGEFTAQSSCGQNLNVSSRFEKALIFTRLGVTHSIMQTAFREIIVYFSKPTPKHSLHMSQQHAWVLNWAVCRLDQSASENIWCLKKLKIEQRTLWSLKHYDAKVGKYVSSVKRTKEQVMQQSGQHATVSPRVLANYKKN